MVFGSTSFTERPPPVIIASLNPRVPVMVSGKCLKSSSIFSRSCLVTELSFFAGSIPVRSTMTGIIFDGSRSSKKCEKFLFGFSSTILIRRFLSFSSDRCGFKSISPLRVPSFISIFAIFDEAESTIGPEIPKCVNSISPNSSYTGFFFFTEKMRSSTFFRESPCICGI